MLHLLHNLFIGGHFNPYFESIVNALRILFTGDFQAPTFGWEEDSTWVTVLFAIRAILTTLF